MSRKFEIGDSFLSWVVIKCVDKKRYRYLCKCKDCGVTKEFVKYNLLNNRYSACKCGSHYLRNTHLIRKYWNIELNSSTFTNPRDFNINGSYWFSCDRGHCFKSSLKTLTKDSCPHCKSKCKHSNIKPILFEVLLGALESLFGCYTVIDDYTVFCEQIEAVFILIEEDRFTSLRYFNSDNELLEEKRKLDKLMNKYKSNGYTIKEVVIPQTPTSEKPKLIFTVDKIQQAMIDYV